MDWLAYVRWAGRRCSGVVLPVLRLLVVAALAHGALSFGQSAVPVQSLEDALHRMSDRAAVVFVGQVVAVRHLDGRGAGSGVVETEFRVDEAVRGCAAGTYVLREWAGLWAGNDARYRVGQRRLMLLHAPGAGGMSSPVDGTDGALPLLGVDTAIQANLTGGTAPATGLMVDLRWLGTKLERPVAYAGAPSLGGVLVTATGVPAATAVQASTPPQSAGVAVVVGLLRGWTPVASEVNHAGH